MDYVSIKADKLDNILTSLTTKYGPEIEPQLVEMCSTCIDVSKSICYDDFQILLDGLDSDTNMLLKKFGLKILLKQLVDLKGFEKERDYNFLNYND